MARRKFRKNTLSQKISGAIAREREAEIEYGLKEFIQGLLVGFIVGFLIATQVL